MAIRKALDMKIKVLPFTAAVEHLYYYEGPCRFGSGEALEPGYDAKSNAFTEKMFLDNIAAYMPECAEVMDMVAIRRTDSWEDPEDQWQTVLAAVAQCDVIIGKSGIASDDLLVELAERTDKPIIMCPDSFASYTAVPAAVAAHKASKDHEFYSFYDWNSVARLVRILFARKVIAETSILCATRFGRATSYSSVDSFASYDEITGRLGTRFRFVNIHELLDQMTPATEDGNHTTPGRKTLDLTEEDMAEAEKMADELIAGAKNVNVEQEMVLKSLYAYITVRKQMEFNDCNAFTAPCPDVCSTRRLNEMQFTFCFTHSLNLEQGIPSLCEFDVSAALTMQALIAISGQRTYTGNTIPVYAPKSGKGNVDQVDRFHFPLGSTDKQVQKLADQLDNFDHVYAMQHSIAHRRMCDPLKDAEYSLEHFAHDQKFGAVMRYDFDKDAGQKITLARFSPDASKMFIASAEILLGDGYDVSNCAQILYFSVKDREDFFQKQCVAGNHICMVYGDYVQDMVDLCKVLGIEPVVAD